MPVLLCTYGDGGDWELYAVFVSRETVGRAKLDGKRRSTCPIAEFLNNRIEEESAINEGSIKRLLPIGLKFERSALCDCDALAS